MEGTEGIREGLNVDEICGFKILDLQNLPVGGVGTHLGTESSVVVMKVEPEPPRGYPSQSETCPVERRVLLDNALPSSNTIQVKEEPSEDSFDAEERRSPILGYEDMRICVLRI
uniref:uncharacterized protein isoform X2 n=1 Tax=Myxine glutinosa TaxID=7769 RepID=UPI00358E27A9